MKAINFLKIDRINREFINSVNSLISKEMEKKKIDFNKLSSIELSKVIYKLQNLINKRYNPEYFFKHNKKIFFKLFKNKNFSIQHYFYLRVVKPYQSKNLKPIDFHRETFQGPPFHKYLYNLWIPLKNCSRENALKYYNNSHTFKRFKDFDFVEKNTEVQKGSYSHKTGNLYKIKSLKFKKKVSLKRLFKKNNFIIFSGEIIHGNATNYTKKIRMSLDARFMLKKRMLNNHKQGATGKNYFKIIKV